MDFFSFRKNIKNIFSAGASAVFFVVIVSLFSATRTLATTTIPTSILVTVCGDGIIGVGEDCDAGYSRNHGLYSTSSAMYQCFAGCVGTASYCGDEILQPLYGEECDDGNNISGDSCDSICRNESAPIAVNLPPVGGGGGGGAGVRGPGVREGTLLATNPTRVIIDGTAYPNSKVYVLQDGKQVAILQTNNNAQFHFEASDVTPGPAIFGFWAEDFAKRRSITMTTTFQVVASAVTTVTGLYLPPTIDISPKTIKLGEKLDIEGVGVASSTVLIYFDSVSTEVVNTLTGVTGKWFTSFEVKNLENEKFHSVKTKTETLASDNTLKRSGFSQSVGFYVGSKQLDDVISSDINKDNKVNIVDFSILLFYWGTSEITTDFNRDNKVNLTDFSIMLYAWTG